MKPNWPIKKLGDFYNFPKMVGAISFDSRQPFPKVQLDNWILLDAKIVENQKIRLKVKAVDTSDEGNTWLRPKGGKQPTETDVEEFLKQLLNLKGKNLLEIEQSLKK